jgi:hypothetical protein
MQRTETERKREVERPSIFAPGPRNLKRVKISFTSLIYLQALLYNQQD